MDLDSVFSHIGQFGKYQKVLAIIYFLQNIMLAWQMVGITFFGADIDFWCDIEEMRNVTPSQQRQIQFNNEKSTCDIYDLPYDTMNFTDLKNDDLYKNVGKRSCETGWIYDQTVFSSTLASTYQLCGRSMEYWSQTALKFGVFVGCFFIGWFSDKFGRKKAIVIFQFLWAAVGLIGAFSPDPLLWIVTRFIMGFSAFGCFDSSFVLAMETTGMEGRSIQSIIFQFYYAAGIASLAGIAWLVPDFFYLQLIMGLFPICLLLIYWLLLDESPRWLISKNRSQEATIILEKIARWNNTSISYSNIDLHTPLPVDDSDLTILDLFKTPGIRRTTLAMWVAWFAVSTGYYGLTFGVENLSGNLFFNHLLSGLIEIPAYFLTYLLIRRVSRKYTTVITYLIVAILLFVIGFIGFAGFNLPIIQIVIVMIGKFFSAMVFALLYLNAAEVFPTALRTIGVGSSSSMARIGGIIQPQIQHIQEIVPFFQYILYGVITLIGVFGTLFIPETLNKTLPETLNDAENYDCQNKNSSENECL